MHSGTALLQAQLRLKGSPKIIARALCAAVMAVTVIGCFLSGIHWFTDLLDGALLGFALILLYLATLRALHLPI